MSVEDMIKSQARRDSGLGQTNDEYTSPTVKEILTRITQIEAVQNTLLKRVNGFKEKSDGADQEILARLDKVEAAVRSISIEPEDVEKFITAAWFLVLTVVVQYWAFFGNFAPGGDFYEKVSRIANSLNMVHFNQTMPGANFSPWDWDAFIGAWRNQEKYIQEQRQQANEGDLTVAQ